MNYWRFPLDYMVNVSFHKDEKQLTMTIVVTVLVVVMAWLLMSHSSIVLTCLHTVDLYH
jgi:cell division protein FtsL